MATTTIYATDAFIQSTSAVYATAAAGGVLVVDTAATYLAVGQGENAGTFYCWEAFLEFDTSVIPAGEDIVSVTLSIAGETDNSGTDFTMEARMYDYGAAFDSGDWVPAASLSGLTLVASYPSASYTAAYMNFTSEAVFPQNINRAGTTRLMLCSSRHRTQTAPGAGTIEYVNLASSRTVGTTADPKLVIVSAAPTSYRFPGPFEAPWTQ